MYDVRVGPSSAKKRRSPHGARLKPVPLIGRILDAVGLLLFFLGAAFYVRAWIGFGTVPSFVPPPDAEPWAAVAVANGFWRLQKIGVALMLAGIVGFVVAWWVARRALSPEDVSEV